MITLQHILPLAPLGIVTGIAILYDVADCIYSEGLSSYLCRLFRRCCCNSNLPNVPKTAHEAAEAEGYELEDHTVQTSDGHLLTLHHLVSPNAKNPSRGQPVLLQHGLCQSSMLFLIQEKQDALAYVLSDLGYDVWLGNNRGNLHSRFHVQYRADEPAFWNWAIDELALDVRANIEYICASQTMNHPQRKVVYIGHSQGAAQGLMAFSRDKELQQKVAAFIAMSPGAHVASTLPSYPMRFLAYLAGHPTVFRFIFGSQEFLPFIDTVRRFCPTALFEYQSFVMFKYLFDWNAGNWDHSRYSAFFSETPAGTSARTVAQWMQHANSGRFQMFCHGAEKNKAIYGTPKPPEYPVENITIPTAVIYGGKDSLLDHDILPEKLTNCVLHKQIDHHEHLDSIFSQDSKQFVYPDIIRVLEAHGDGAVHKEDSIGDNDAEKKTSHNESEPRY